MRTCKILFIALAATAFSACNMDRTLEYVAPDINVSANVEANAVTTRAIDNGATATSGSKYTTTEFQNSGNFLPNTSIAVYVEEVDPTTGKKVASSNMNYATPAEYINDNNTDYSKFRGKLATQSFPTSGKNVKVYAFYPYSEFSAITDRTLLANETHQFTVQTDQTTIANYRSSDLMADSIVGTGTPKPGIRNTTAALNFKHLLSKVTIIVKRNSGITDAQLDGAVVWIKNTNTSASLNMNKMYLNETSSGSHDYTHASGSANNIKVMALATGDLPNSIDDASPSEIKASAIVVPQPIGTTNPFITVALTAASGSGEFKYTPGTTFNLVGGNEYIYTITIKNQGIDVEGVITAWDDNSGANTGSGDATL